MPPKTKADPYAAVRRRDAVRADRTHQAALSSACRQCLPGRPRPRDRSGPEAKYCLVFAATRNHKTVIGTVMASSSISRRTTDATEVLTHGFARPG